MPVNFDQEVLQKLSNCFIFVGDENKMGFTCPLVKYYYRKEYAKFKTGISSPKGSFSKYAYALVDEPILDILL
jgi:hypothetical protein